MSSIPSNLYKTANYPLGIIKKVSIGEKRKGVAPTPLGVPGLKISEIDLKISEGELVGEFVVSIQVISGYQEYNYSYLNFNLRYL